LVQFLNDLDEAYSFKRNQMMLNLLGQV